MTRLLFGEPGTPRAGYRRTELIIAGTVIVFFAFFASEVPILGHRLDPVTGAKRTGILTQLEYLTQDVRFIARKTQPPARVAIVAIDKMTLEAKDDATGKPLGQFPFPRDYHARIVRNLKADGARAIIFDIIFNEPDRMGKDAELAAAMKEAGNVYLLLANEGALPAPDKLKEKLTQHLYPEELGRGAGSIGGIGFPIESLYQNIAGTGFFEAQIDPDGKFRRVSPFFKIAGTDLVVPHLGLEVARRALNLRKDDLRLVPRGLSLGGTVVPVTSGSFVLDYYGGSGSIDTIPYATIYNHRFAPRTFNDKVVIIGMTAEGTKDIRPNPFDQNFTGVELNATFIANLIESDFINYPGNLTRWLLVTLSGLMVWLFVARMSLLGGALFTGGMMAVYMSITVGVFQHPHLSLMLPVMPVLLTTLFAYGGVTIYRAFTEEKQKKFFNDTFRQYVPPEFVDMITENPSMLDLGGERKEVTVLFSDIRGFTTWSEQGDPHEVVAQLNEYLTVMSEIIADQRGTLDKFIGDAIMAFWNAPVEQHDHAERCVRAAIGMQYALRELHRRWEAENRPLLTIGVGVNTGMAVVGNTGSPIRKNYTLLGDSVNLAARLEGVTKEFHLTVLVSESTYKRVEDKFIGREVDSIRVKGKLEPVKIYEVLADRENGLDEDMQRILEHYNVGLETYKNRQWQDALAHFARALAVRSTDPDGPSLTYRGRCREYSQNPPGDDWDGVYVMTRK